MSSEVQGKANPTLLSKRVQWNNGASKPDWSILDRALSREYKTDELREEQQLIYVHGESKLKQKWKSEWLSLGDSNLMVKNDPTYAKPGAPVEDTGHHSVVRERLLPIRQLATYCRWGKTRYGYIVTQEELVAFRIRRLERSDGKKHDKTPAAEAAVEYKGVPWNASKLTVNLVIWALGCMGMNDTHRLYEDATDCSPLKYMARLALWEKSTGGYTNTISQRFISEDDWPKFTKDKQIDVGKFDDSEDPTGKSHISSFLGDNEPLPPLRAGRPGLRSNPGMLAEELANQAKSLSLQEQKDSSGSASSTTAGKKPVASIQSPPVQPKGSAGKAASATSSQSEPPARKEASATPPQTKPPTAKKAAPAHPDAPAAGPSTRQTRSTAAQASAKVYTHCVLNGNRYKLEFEKGSYYVTLNNKRCAVEQDDQTKTWWVKTKPQAKISKME